MRTISASELGRRGISAWDEILKDGAVHVTKDGGPSYVIVDEDLCRELVDRYAEAEQVRIGESLEDVKAGRVRPVTVEDLARQLGVDDLDVE